MSRSNLSVRSIVPTTLPFAQASSPSRQSENGSETSAGLVRNATFPVWGSTATISFIHESVELSPTAGRWKTTYSCPLG